MRRVLMLCAAIMLLAASCTKKSSLTTPTTSSVRGQLYGVMKLPRPNIPVESRPERLWKLGENKLPIGSVWISVSADSSEYEFRRTYPTDSLSITIGGQPAQIHPDGTFEAENVPVGQQTIIFSLRGEAVRTQTVSIVAGKEDLSLEIERVVDVCCPAKPMSAQGTAETFPCLDNNGVWPGGFTNSDCFESLFFGPPWYSWMCWSEAMDKVHDHYGNIWCNGTHNCSLFVHGWDWNKQRWHTHTWPWVAKW